MRDLASLVVDEPSSTRTVRTGWRPCSPACPDRYRRILELRFLEGCSVKESAREIGVSIANAKVMQHRALRLAAGSMIGGES